jgi:hypothetical protein
MKPSELYEALHALISERVPLHVWGPCGVGKSQIVAQVAADRKCEFLDIRAVQLDPVDLRGLPRISGDRAEWVAPKFLPLDGEGILFLDELTSAPQMILRAATANDAAQILTEMDAVLRERGQLPESDSAANSVSADDIFAHMAAYMEAPVS